jgi:hypothetical protein
VTKENIDSLLKAAAVTEEFDLLSVDVDQNTYYIWEGMAHYRPRVVVVEYNATFPPQHDWKVAYAADKVWDGSNYFGASLKAFERLGARMGYRLVGCETAGANAFFVREDCVGKKFCAPFTAENHFEPPRYFLTRRCGHPPGFGRRAE